MSGYGHSTDDSMKFDATHASPGSDAGRILDADRNLKEKMEQMASTTPPGFVTPVPDGHFVPIHIDQRGIPIDQLGTGVTIGEGVPSPPRQVSPPPVPPEEKFELNETVLLNPLSGYAGQSEGNLGTVISVNDEKRTFRYKVRWNNVGTYSYNGRDLLHSSPEMIAKCEAEIKKYKKVIVSPKLDKLFKSERKEFNLADYYFPFTYLLGQKDGVYTDAVLLHGHHGCSEFQTIQSTIIFKAYAQLVKKGLLVNGMCRIGKFANYSYHNIRELGFHHNGDVMLLISINANHIWSHIFGNDYQTTRVKEPYIVAKRKKGGDKYAKRKE